MPPSNGEKNKNKYTSTKRKNQSHRNTQNLRGKPSSIEGKITGQIRSIHYNKITITILKLCPKLELTINWKNTKITSLGIKYSLTTKMTQ